MNQLSFVVAAYAVVIGGSIVLTVWAWRSMVAAERFADEVTKR